MLGGSRGVHRCPGGGIAGDIGAGQRRDDEYPAQEPGQREHHRGSAHIGGHPQRQVIASPEHRRQKQDRHGQDRVRPAVANQVQTRLVPPPAKAGSTTLAGSRKMSGQLNVDDNTIAAAANATAPATNNPPVVQRSPRPVLADARSGRTTPELVPAAAWRVVMPAAKAKTVQQMAEAVVTRWRPRSPPHWVRGSGSEQHGWRPGSLAAGGVAVISPLSPPRVPDGGFIAGQPGRARSLSCTGSQQRRCVR